MAKHSDTMIDWAIEEVKNILKSQYAALVIFHHNNPGYHGGMSSIFYKGDAVETELQSKLAKLLDEDFSIVDIEVQRGNSLSMIKNTKLLDQNMATDKTHDTGEDNNSERLEYFGDELHPNHIFDTIHLRLLIDIANKKLDPMALVRRELARRGLNKVGDWVGFDKAKKEYKNWMERNK